MFSHQRLPSLTVPGLLSRTVSVFGFRALLLCAAVAITTGEQTARADADETSLHAEIQLGRATFGDPALDEATDTAGFMGVGARATYATNDWYAYEAHLNWGQLVRSAEFTQEDGGALFRRLGWLRLDTGITARLGAQYIPTLHAALGVQSRFGGAATVSYPNWTLRDDDYVTLDLVSTLGAGFDWRRAGDGDHWVFGGLVMWQRALLTTGTSYEAASVMFHVAYYFY